MKERALHKEVRGLGTVDIHSGEDATTYWADTDIEAGTRDLDTEAELEEETNFWKGMRSWKDGPDCSMCSSSTSGNPVVSRREASICVTG